MPASEREVEPRLQLAVAAAREAGRITLEYFGRRDLAVEQKADQTPVTAADRGAEQHLRQRIAAAFPDDAILGEEFPDRPGNSGFRWILDPLDGTKSFVRGVPLYGTLVAVEHEDQSAIGVIEIPPLDERVYAAMGHGAWHVLGDGPPQPARVSSRPLGEGLFLTSDSASFDRVGRRDAYDRLQSAAKLSRSWGDCYGYLLVATGRAEVMIDPVVALWDLAALLPIIVEAGGQFSDWQGRPTVRSGQAVATNTVAYEEVLAALQPPGAAAPAAG
jgi:histidinol phosphatase-like enzyme (inositol monophosphatase family)